VHKTFRGCHGLNLGSGTESMLFFFTDPIWIGVALRRNQIRIVSWYANQDCISTDKVFNGKRCSLQLLSLDRVGPYFNARIANEKAIGAESRGTAGKTPPPKFPPPPPPPPPPKKIKSFNF